MSVNVFSLGSFGQRYFACSVLLPIAHTGLYHLTRKLTVSRPIHPHDLTSPVRTMSIKMKGTTKRSGTMMMAAGGKRDRGARATERPTPPTPTPTPTFVPNLRFMVILVILSTVALLAAQMGYVNSVTDVRGLISDLQSTNPSSSFASRYMQEEELETLHVVFGLMGTKESLYDSWEMALKSVLANAPTDYDLEVHVICDAETACPSIEQRMMGFDGPASSAASASASHEQKYLPLGGDIRLLLQDSNSSRWRNSVQLTLHSASQHQNEKWRGFMAKTFNHTEIDDRVSLGGYYRLLFHDLVLNSTSASPPPSSSSDDSQRQKLPWIYMDPDVLIMRNLNDMVRFLKEDQAKAVRSPSPGTSEASAASPNNEILFYASKGWLCSGFIVVYPELLPTLWNLVDEIVRSDDATGPNKTIDVRYNNDQDILTWILEKYPDRVGALPEAWLRNLGNGYRPRPQKILADNVEGAAMFHFQGGSGPKRIRYGTNYYGEGKDLMEFCDRVKTCSTKEEEKEKYKESWGLGSYYLRLPWRWMIQNYGRANLRPDDPEGHPFIFEIDEYDEEGTQSTVRRYTSSTFGINNTHSDIQLVQSPKALSVSG